MAESVALRYFILFIGVMSCFYSVWDIIDGELRAHDGAFADVFGFPSDTIARKVNSSDASEFAVMIGCCPSRVWGKAAMPPNLVSFC